MRFEPMTKEQYSIQIERLMNFYGNGKITKQFVERVWDHVNYLPYDNFIRIVDNVMDGSRYLPTPKEFADLAKFERQSLRVPLEDEPTFIDCERCGDTGFMWANSFHDHPVWMFCNCAIGARRVKEKSYKLMKYMPQLGNIQRKFPTEFFIPPRIDMESMSEEKRNLLQFNFVQKRMVEFKRDLSESESYWMSLAKEKQGDL